MAGTYIIGLREPGSKKSIWRAGLLLPLHATQLAAAAHNPSHHGTDEVMTQAQAWQAFDLWLTDRRVLFLENRLILTASSVLFPPTFP